MNAIKSPVAWQRFDDWALTGQHGMRPIYLSVMRGKLCVRDAATDRRVALTPEHPIAEEIVRAVNAHDELLAALKTILDAVDYTRDNCRTNDMVSAALDRVLIANARQALARAEGKAPLFSAHNDSQSNK